MTPALAAEALVIPCRWTGGGVLFLSGLLEAWPSWRMPTRVLRTLWWLGPPLQALGPTGAPPCFSEEVGVGALPCSWPPDGVFLSSDGVGKTVCLGKLSCLHSRFKPFILACFLCLENKLLLVLLSRGALGSSRGSSGSLPTPQPSPAACAASAAWWSGSCSVRLTEF